MNLIKFEDKCQIWRDKPDAEYDEYDNPVRDLVYEGACNYQEGGISSWGIISRRPTLFIPTSDVLVYINDVVKITTWSGRQIESLVDIPRDIKLTINSEVKVTRLELKQAIGD